MHPKSEFIAPMDPLIVGNWKLNGDRAAVAQFVAASRTMAAGQGGRVVLCPPVPYLSLLGEALRDAGLADRIGVGAQDCSVAAKGSHTGEISAGMLADVGAHHVILGHSERRDAGETDAQIAGKLARAAEAGLSAILCIGETEAQRSAGAVEATLAQQLSVLNALPTTDRVIIAYEPVWAIGGTKPATPDDIAAVLELLPRLLPNGKSLPTLYGGSVSADTTAELCRVPGLNGFLVGRASLAAKQFWPLVRSAVAQFTDLAHS